LSQIAGKDGRTDSVVLVIIADLKGSSLTRMPQTRPPHADGPKDLLLHVLFVSQITAGLDNPAQQAIT
jgi:hypothetical protein